MQLPDNENLPLTHHALQTRNFVPSNDAQFKKYAYLRACTKITCSKFKLATEVANSCTIASRRLSVNPARVDEISRDKGLDGSGVSKNSKIKQSGAWKLAVLRRTL